MKASLQWMKVLGLALSLPTTIAAVVLVTMKLVKIGIITKMWAFIISILVIGNTIFLMVWYAYRNKNRS